MAHAHSLVSYPPPIDPSLPPPGLPEDLAPAPPAPAPAPAYAEGVAKDSMVANGEAVKHHTPPPPMKLEDGVGGDVAAAVTMEDEASGAPLNIAEL
eukprot:CAMPEP_0183298232 /NCGR_PEP_ID=MMETSP0160_2-20130417/5317_1 /TAXON_ID=2839 ORGANISM="Odontella Sinensis, Strain Grunow 1884" /NCGR_SAMPLE_ID=MMETSP0160_2 /ASSEMBLY_ACC=CAM_ASM_000250 /LENGTH=95 /DNA_ID=CAMNT_0025460223 /DNA_START=79 /DNA_END=366 /DNA_ORIENTATION=+